MTTLYKLTDYNDCTTNNTQWCEGIEHTASGIGELCSRSFLHAYEHPLIAVFMNPVHGNFRDPHLWLADGDVTKRDGQLKCGCARLKTTKRIELPTITIEQRVEVAIRCAKLVCDDESWSTWADKWLSGEDRTTGAARSALASASGPAEAWSAEAWSAEAWSAEAWTVAAASRAAVAAVAAEEKSTELDLIAILEQVCVGDS